MKTMWSVVGQVANLRTDCQSVHPGADRTLSTGTALQTRKHSTLPNPYRAVTAGSGVFVDVFESVDVRPAELTI